MKLCAVAAAAVIGATPGAALDLVAPVACRLGSECHVRQVVDRDPGSGVADFTCGSLSYDGHQGVDFGLPTLEAMRRGVAVVAAAPGVVAAVRDGMADRAVEDDAGRGAVEGRECGNGVLIDHGEGWTTQYCHMARGSVSVARGDRVEAGRELGRIGLSGLTQFPHLHLTVRKDGEVIDPFDARPASAPCRPGTPEASLWRADSGVRYRPGGVLGAGLSDRVPDYGEITDRGPDSTDFDESAPAIVVWAHFYGLRRGDVIETRLLGPAGQTLATDRHAMDRNRATQFRATGIRRPSGGWIAGTYRGISDLVRDGRSIATAKSEANVR